MIRNIQALRAVAAYLVVIYHATPFINNLHPASFGSHIGAAGVDIFFIISGFIMIFTTEDHKISTADFCASRITRIVPLYWLATLCMIAISLIGFAPSGLHGWSISDLFASLFFIPNVRRDGIPEPILSVGWTLLYEMFFYFLFGLGLLLRNQVRSLLLITCVFILLWAAGRIFNPSSFLLAYYMHPLPLEFSAGCLLGLVYTRTSWLTWKHPLAIAVPLAGAAIAIIVVSDLYYRGLFLEVREARLIVFGVPAIMIVSAALILESSGVRRISRFIMLQGAASYAIYLFHPLILHSTFKTLSVIPLKDSSVVASIMSVTAIIAVCIGGTFVHLHLEKPITRYLRGTSRVIATSPKTQEAFHNG